MAPCILLRRTRSGWRGRRRRRRGRRAAGPAPASPRPGARRARGPSTQVGGRARAGGRGGVGSCAPLLRDEHLSIFHLLCGSDIATGMALKSPAIIAHRMHGTAHCSPPSMLHASLAQHHLTIITLHSPPGTLHRPVLPAAPPFSTHYLALSGPGFCLPLPSSSCPQAAWSWSPRRGCTTALCCCWTSTRSTPPSSRLVWWASHAAPRCAALCVSGMPCRAALRRGSGAALPRPSLGPAGHCSCVPAVGAALLFLPLPCSSTHPCPAPVHRCPHLPLPRPSPTPAQEYNICFTTVARPKVGALLLASTAGGMGKGREGGQTARRGLARKASGLRGMQNARTAEESTEFGHRGINRGHGCSKPLPTLPPLLSNPPFPAPPPPAALAPAPAPAGRQRAAAARAERGDGAAAARDPHAGAAPAHGQGADQGGARPGGRFVILDGWAGFGWVGVHGWAAGG